MDASKAARAVGTDEDRAPPHPVDPHASRQREEDPWQEADDAQDAHLQGAGPEDVDGQQWQREERDLVTELADRLPGPELHEVALAPQAGPMRGGGGDLGRRRLAGRSLDGHVTSFPAQSGT